MKGQWVIITPKVLRVSGLAFIVLIFGILLPIPVFAQEDSAVELEGFTPTIEDFLAAFAMLADVIGEGLVAISLGWALKPA